MRANRLLLFCLGIYAVTVASCSNDSDPQERIQKLRALGVSQSPVIAKVGSNVALTFYLAGPKGKTIAASTYTDAAFKYGTNASVTLVDTQTTETNYGPLSVYALRAKFTVTKSTPITATIATSGNARLRYGVAFNATDGDTQTVVGDTLVYSDSAPQQSWVDPTVSITKPVADSVSGTTAIDADIATTNDEGDRVGWFVSSGSVTNRRGHASDWKDASSGDQTLILTVRGAKSGSFAIKARKVTVQ